MEKSSPEMETNVMKLNRFGVTVHAGTDGEVVLVKKEAKDPAAWMNAYGVTIHNDQYKNKLWQM